MGEGEDCREEEQVGKRGQGREQRFRSERRKDGGREAPLRIDESPKDPVCSLLPTVQEKNITNMRGASQQELQPPAFDHTESEDNRSQVRINV